MQGLAPLLNDQARDVYRTSLRNACFRLLNDVDFPGQEAQLGRAWLQAERRTVEQMERFKERTLEVLQENRSRKQAA